MSDALVLPVPERLHASYVVPATAVPVDPVELARHGVARHPELSAVWPEVEAFLADPACAVGVLPVADAPPLPLAMLEAFGAAEDDLRIARSAVELVVLQVAAPPSWPPRHDRAARLLTAAIALELGAPVFEPDRHRLLSAWSLLAPFRNDGDRDDGDRSDGGDRNDGDKLNGGGRFAHAITVAQSFDDDGLWATTVGLDRFGLPELQALSVPPHLAPVWPRVMTGVAYALVRAWCSAVDGAPDAAFIEFPAVLTVAAADVAAATAAAADGVTAPPSGADAPGSVAIGLGLDPSMVGHDSFLTMRSPEPTAEGDDGFFTLVCRQLLGAAPPATASHRTDRSPQAAVERLRALRSRFLDGEFSASTCLLVKLRLRDPDEHTWLLIEEWPQPEVVRGHPDSDARHHPEVREGHFHDGPVADVVDWVVVTEDGTQLEHAWHT